MYAEIPLKWIMQFFSKDNVHVLKLRNFDALTRSNKPHNVLIQHQNVIFSFFFLICIEVQYFCYPFFFISAEKT